MEDVLSQNSLQNFDQRPFDAFVIMTAFVSFVVNKFLKWSYGFSSLSKEKVPCVFQSAILRGLAGIYDGAHELASGSRRFATTVTI